MILPQFGSSLSAPTIFCARIISFMALRLISPPLQYFTPEVARSALKNLLASHEKSGVRYWSGGEINLKAMNEMMRAQKIVGALKDDPDWSKIIDESFLPDDLKKKTN